MPVAESDGVKIQYEVAGAGEPLLLIMGYGAPGAAWALSLPYFTEKFQVITFDNRGTGHSDAPDDGYTVPQFARDARAVLDAAGWESAHVFGISMGGMIAQQLALDVPGRVRSLVLGCTTCGQPDPTPDSMEAGRQLMEAFKLAPTDPEGAIRMMLPLSYPQSFIDAHPELVPLGTAALRMLPTRRVPEVELEGGDLQGWETCSRLHELTMPALVLHGTEDRLIPVTHAYRLFEGLSNVELRIYKGAGHIFQAQDFAGINTSIVAWLSTRPAPAPAPASAPSTA